MTKKLTSSLPSKQALHQEIDQASGQVIYQNILAMKITKFVTKFFTTLSSPSLEKDHAGEIIPNLANF